MLMQRIESVVARLLFFLVALWPAAKQPEIRVGARGQQMPGFVVLNGGETARPAAGTEQKMGRLLGETGFAQAPVAGKYPGVVKHIPG